MPEALYRHEKQAPDDGYQHNREEVEFTAFFCIIHDIND